MFISETRSGPEIFRSWRLLAKIQVAACGQAGTGVVAALAEALGVRASLMYVPVPPEYEEIGVMDIERTKKI